MSSEKQRVSFSASVGLFESLYLLGKLEQRIALERYKDFSSYTAETHPSSEEIKWVMDFAHNFLESFVGRDLGYLRPNLKNILIYTEEEFEIAKKRYDLDPMSRAFSKQLSGEIHLNGSESRFTFFHHIIHEYVHLLSRQRMMIRHGAQSSLAGRVVSAASDFQGGLGMNVHEKFVALNEVITEMLACEILGAIQASRGDEFDFSDLEPAYKPTLYTLGSFLFELSKRAQIPFCELRDIFYRAYVEGDMSRLRLITKHFGAKATGEISDFPVFVDEIGAGSFLYKYGLYTDDTAQKYNELNVINLFEVLAS